MALPTIQLDDRTFEQLFAFLRKQIDTNEWIDHNYSDPGIALLDLLCWMGEMILYRADRIPQEHIGRFASLILDPPEPVTVPLTLTATVDAARTTELIVPPKTRFATNYELEPATGSARRFVFETIVPVRFKAPLIAADLTQIVVTTAREYLEVSGESLGISDGTPNQVFPFRPIHADLGLPLDRPTPVLLDFVHPTPAYEPNPMVTVGGTPWELRRFLQTESSFIDPSGPPVLKEHYMVDPDANAVRFGDNRFGSIPAAGAPVVCTSYRLLQGPDALIPAGDIVHQLDAVPGLGATESITFVNGDAEGADYFFRPEDRIREGLRRFHRPARLITESDFEQVILVDFNELQARARKPATAPRILRAIVLMNRKPTAPAQPAAGHVTIAVLPAATGMDINAALTDPSLPDALKISLVTPAPALLDKLRRFLDKRRLITTRLHLASPPQLLPKLVMFSMTATIIIDSDRNIAEMTSAITARIRSTFGVVSGGFDGRGWPMGGSVYRSKLFRLLEDIDGVDHVDALTLSPADPNGDVVLDGLSLPAIAFGGLALSVFRA